MIRKRKNKNKSNDNDNNIRNKNKSNDKSKNSNGANDQERRQGKLQYYQSFLQIIFARQRKTAVQRLHRVVF